MDEKVPRHPKVEIKDDYWYIGDFTNPTRPKLLWRDFISKPLAVKAKRRVRALYPDKNFMVLLGKDARIHKIRVSRKWLNFKFEKYEYPEDRTPGQRKKTFRTTLRRKLRRWPKKELKKRYPELIQYL